MLFDEFQKGIKCQPELPQLKATVEALQVSKTPGKLFFREYLYSNGYTISRAGWSFGTAGAFCGLVVGL